MNEKEFLTELINDERNSALFYSHLSTLADSSPIRTAIENISVECGATAAMLMKYCRSLGYEAGGRFGNIEKNVSVVYGIEWAISVENESIEKIKNYSDRNNVYRSFYKSKLNRIKSLEYCQKILTAH